MAKAYGLGRVEVGTRDILDRQSTQGSGEKEGGKDEGEIIKKAVLNTAYTPPGVHWFAVYDGYVYDPLGDDKSGNAEQPKSWDDCGQRCIAYLVLCNKLGGSVQL